MLDTSVYKSSQLKYFSSIVDKLAKFISLVLRTSKNTTINICTSIYICEMSFNYT